MIIRINDIDLSVEVTYKPQNKHMYMKVRDGVVFISTYKRLHEKEIRKILEDNFDRIKTIIEVKNEKMNILHFLGVEYEIDVIESKENDIYIKDNKFVILTKSFEQEYIRKIVYNFYTRQAEIYITNIFDDILNKFSDIISFKPKLVFKYLKTAYGKCYPKRKQITFSGISMKLEPKYIEYIIFHELSHFKYLGHQKDFYSFLESKMPNAIKYGKQIRRLKYKDIF